MLCYDVHFSLLCFIIIFCKFLPLESFDCDDKGKEDSHNGEQCIYTSREVLLNLIG